MPRVPKSAMQLYREKLAKALSDRMPFYDTPSAQRLYGGRYADELMPAYDYYGHDPYATERDDSFMVGFPRASSRTVHIDDLAPEDMWELNLEPDVRPSGYEPIRVPKSDVDSLASAIYGIGRRIAPKWMDASREDWNRRLAPNPYPQDSYPEDLPVTEDNFMDWRMRHFRYPGISQSDYDYFKRRAQRDWNDWVKQEALKRKLPRY